ncbi:hypothetical protein [Salinibacter sp.]|uniref:hypothetical protein n=1 Tax=Salinibacter sp. TaxID=2065818 RepID=UPI0021E83316|nr:hypothetical protein [Salinibacter sp.]
MSSRTSDNNAQSPEHSFEHTEVYRHRPLYRWGAYGTAGIVALSVLAISGTMVIKGLSGTNWGAYTGAIAGLIGAAVSVPSLLAELSLTEDRLRKERPLRAGREVSFEEVRRVFIGGVSVEIYVDADHEPALTFHRHVQDSDDLIEKLVARLPASAEIDHPSGELDGRLEIA